MACLCLYENAFICALSATIEKFGKVDAKQNMRLFKYKRV